MRAQVPCLLQADPAEQEVGVPAEEQRLYWPLRRTRLLDAGKKLSGQSPRSCSAVCLPSSVSDPKRSFSDPDATFTGNSPLTRIRNRTYLGYLLCDLRWSRWVLSGDVGDQCCSCTRTCINLGSLQAVVNMGSLCLLYALLLKNKRENIINKCAWDMVFLFFYE